MGRRGPSRPPRNELFGTYLSEAIQSLARQQMTVGPTIQLKILDMLNSEPALNKTRANKRVLYTLSQFGYWARGYYPPPNVVLSLVRYIIEIGYDNQKCVQNLLESGGFTQREALEWTQKLFPGDNPMPTSPTHNLPPLMVMTDFLGYNHESTTLYQWLRKEKGNPVICIYGMGGMGKSTLAIYAAYHAHGLLDLPPELIDEPFKYCVWITAKDQGKNGRWLEHVLHTTGRVIGFPIIERTASLDEKLAMIEKKLRSQRILLIIDNFETIQDEDLINWLQDIPYPSKVILTSRIPVEAARPLSLTGLKQNEAEDLFKSGCRELNIEITEEDYQWLPKIHAITEGNPLIIEHLIRRFKDIATLHKVVKELEGITIEGDTDIDEALLTHLFGKEWESLGKEGQEIWMAAALCVDDIPRATLLSIAAIPPVLAKASLRSVSDISILRYSKRTEVYHIHPIAQDFGRKHLRAADKTRDMKQRYIHAYRDLAEEHGGPDWHLWTAHYIPLQAQWTNLSAAFDFAIQLDDKESLTEFWFDRMSYISDILGYWPERIRWYTYLAERSGDPEVKIFALSSAAWTHVLMGNYKQAKQHLQLAWQMKESASAFIQSDLVSNCTFLAIRQHDYPEALELLQLHQNIARKIPADDRRKGRQLAQNPYYKGYILYDQRSTNQEALGEAKENFSAMLDLSSQIQWLRGQIYTQNWLADIAIAEGEPEKALEIVEAALPISENNKDLRRTGLLQRSMAYAYTKMERSEKAYTSAKTAILCFERLGMQEERQQILSDFQLEG
jgi:tetratricopeptide (TPR) repeat protein